MDQVTVAFGGPSLEHDVSILTGLQCERYLTRAGVGVQCLYWDRGGVWYLVPNGTEARDYLDGPPKQATALELTFGAAERGFVVKRGLRRSVLDLGTVLSAFHGGAGEGGGAQALWQLLGVKATGGTIEAAALGMDKLAFGALMIASGLPSLPREALSAVRPPSFAGPYIVKPRYGGSSIGIEVVEDYESALAVLEHGAMMRSGAVVEPYRPDLFDLNIAFRTYPAFEVSALEKPERKPGGGIYTFDEKYVESSGLANAPREIPAKVSAAIAAQAADVAGRVAELTRMTGLCRLDFLSDGEQLYVNELNSIPGAMALYLWPGADPSDLLRDLVREAASASAGAPVAGFGETRALRAAGGIAGKLVGPRAPGH